MPVFNHIEPNNVFSYFETISGIPRGSRNTKAVSKYCLDFAEKRHLEAYTDESNNVIIIKEASKGYENSQPVILQGHLDMVCEKAPDCTKDMETMGIDLILNNDTVSADGTTLGGDNGIGVAMILSILDDNTLSHPRIEAILTSDEEIGMIGASAIDVSPIKGKRMINLDSEDEGIFTVSCAGGNLTECTLPVARESFEGNIFEIKVDGLTGGHSGTEINKGLGNANILLGKFLNAVSKICDFRIISINGGFKDNAIPTDSKAVISLNGDIPCDIIDIIKEKYRLKYQSDPNLRIDINRTNSTLLPTDEASTKNILSILCRFPNGVQAFSPDHPDFVETSLNLGILSTNEKNVTASYCIRSSVNSSKIQLTKHITQLMEQLGGSAKVSGDYNGFAYNKDSELLKRMTQVFEECYSKEPILESIHAGVECGVFSGKIPMLDCVSIGPNIKDIHTFRESLSISSVKRVYEYLIKVLEKLQ